jgi:para-nitrobenzyl esterase
VSAVGDLVSPETASGRVRGVRRDGAISFRGIPYATAPRFAAPGVVPGWAGVRDAMEPGPAAPQPARSIATFTHGVLPATSEECLNLNVFTPSVSGSRPVLVWLHGGGFTVGHAGASLYDGSALARSADAVVVTVNYRLGSLGWLSHPQLAAGPGAATGNWGLLDQMAALDWVAQNIAGFGGDPKRVTLAGQSAGALCALDLLVAPGTAGLFRRVILQSPPLADVAQPAEVGAKWAQALSAAAGGSGPLDVAALRALPAQRMVDLHEALLEAPEFRGTRGGALPTLDPVTLPHAPTTTPGARPDVDVLIGSTAQEGTFFFNSPWRPPPPPERIAAIVGHLSHTDAPEVVIDRYRRRAAAQGRPTGQLSLLVDIATDAMVAGPSAAWASHRATALAVGAGAGPGSVYRYRVDHPGAGVTLRATHTVDVPLLFGTWRDGGPGERLGGQAAGSAEVGWEIVQAWARFIHGDSPGWDRVSAGGAEDEIGVFGGSHPFTVEFESSR